MKINIEEILTENEDIKNDNDTKVQEKGCQDEVLKLKIALDEKEKQNLSILADFDNLKKRTDRDLRLRVEDERVKLISRILEVIDNLERAIDSAKNYRHDPFFDGILSIYKQLISVLREYRVEHIDCLEKEFDPNLHEAVGAINTSDFGRNTVINEVQKGYIMDNKLLRPSKVHVAV